MTDLTLNEAQTLYARVHRECGPDCCLSGDECETLDHLLDRLGYRVVTHHHTGGMYCRICGQRVEPVAREGEWS